MPHIHRIRVNNVKYNFGTQFYDDFVMRFDGRNALYDLANGGGKSVLMLLLFQNLIPNCTLDDKQPVEKLFRTSDGSTTIHSLIEWKLEETGKSEAYKYMLTGFCARRAKDDGSSEVHRDAAAIEYFNYVIFYREYNDNDIINLPLKKGRERITYPGLKAYLKELAHKDYNLDVHIFERKGEYQRFISHYGLYESAWEIIRGINKTEGHVRTYFETHYKTTRKVVEDLLIEEIIQKAFLMKEDGKEENDMAKTLLEIKDKLLELSQKKAEISGYNRQIEVLESFIGRIETLDKLYADEEAFRMELVKTCNTAAYAIRQKEKEAALAEKEKTLYAGRVNEATRRLDTVKIQESQERLRLCEDDSQRFDEELSKLRSLLAQKHFELGSSQSMNDYLEYVDYKKKADGVKHAMEHANKDHGALLALLRAYAKAQRACFDQNGGQWQEELHSLSEKIKGLEDGQREGHLAVGAKEKTLAVAENEVSRYTAEIAAVQGELSRLRLEVNALLVEGSERELRNNRIEQKNKAEALAENERQRQEIREAMHEARVRLAAIGAEEGRLEEAQKEFEAFTKEYEQKKEKAQKLLEIYHCSDFSELKDVIYSRYDKLILDMYRCRENLEKDRALAAGLSENNPVVAVGALREIADDLRRYHGVTCVLGSEYLYDLSADERRELLERIPYLPWSVIVKNDFSKVAGDHMLWSRDYGDGVYPILGLDAVLSKEPLTVDGHVLFLTKDRELYYDKAAVLRRKAAVEQRIQKAGRELERFKDSMETYRSDGEYIRTFLVNYQGKFVDKMALHTKNCEQQACLKAEAGGLTENIAQWSAQLGQLEADGEQLTALAQELAAQERALEAMVQANGRLQALERALADYREEQRSLSVQLTQLKLKLDADAKAMEQVVIRRSFVEQQLREQEKLWKENYSAYYRADGDGEEGASSLSEKTSDEIDAAFQGVREAYEKEHTDMEDKRQLLESHTQAMERLSRLIEERDFSMETMETRYLGGELTGCSPEVIAALKEEIGTLRGKIDEMEKTAEAVKANKNRLFGSVENAILAVEEKYGSFAEVELKGRDYAVYASEQQAILETSREKYAQAQQRLERFGRELRALEDVFKDLKRLVHTAAVSYSLTKDFYTDVSHMSSRYEELNGRYERLCADERQKKEAFEKNRDQLADVLKELHAYELAHEIRYQVELPKNEEDAQILINNIRETIQVIDLEKSRVHQGIRDMEQIKESFENQCLQRCLDIRTELERLPGLSLITLDGQPVPMVQLKIPYVREETCRAQMSDYINQVVTTADSYGDFDEKLKYIRQKLSWKNLFSVIVSDMNAIRLNLYKRERIREQSRYLRYEEAVGSTGQSQGIYIQFLIAVINYISAIYAPDVDAAAAKKVIFIDNPFGAAKDIYIWEPIFELLRTNNVQLIVPARGATPAISGKFDVNYVLGQKLIDGKIQTVVVDFYSNVKTGDMEYVKIDFEQEVFDFL